MCSPRQYAPAAITTAAANVNNPLGTAELNGQVQTGDSNLVSVVFEYGTSPTLATSTATPSQTLSPPVGGGALTVPTQPVTGLAPGTYYYRVVATINGVRVPGQIVSFVVSATAAPVSKGGPV